MYQITEMLLSGSLGVSGKVHPALHPIEPPSDVVGVVVEGVGCAQLHQIDGKRLIYRFIKPGDFIGLVDAIHIRYSALTRCKVLYAKRDAIAGLPEFDQVLHRETAMEAKALGEHSSTLVFCDAEERFEWALIQLGDAFEGAEYPRQRAYNVALTHARQGVAGVLSDMTGVRPETISRLKKRVAKRLLE